MPPEDKYISRKPNRLINEKSPYLLQHAYNPVDWYPWGDEAFRTAREENKPVFLSIGYSTCHWCHVMERESFEDHEVAKLLNDVFVPVKVDREERPDIDSIYMDVCQMMTGSGGWPLTILMTHDRKPFLAGTYFPRTSRFGRIGMLELITRIRDAWKNQRDLILSTADKLTGALRSVSEEQYSGELDESVMDSAFNHLLEAFDSENGGFGPPPRFPMPHNIFFLLRYWKRTGEKMALKMAEQTLLGMLQGGINDHIGSGFHRYSTDSSWLLPHFEKMLYDQALLAMAYIEAYQATGREEFGDTARGVFEYVLRDMRSPGGGFYSAEDADSEGVEGRFYLWRREEILSALGSEEGELFIKAYRVEEDGNFTDETGGERNGLNILHTGRSLEAVSAELGIPSDEIRRRLERSKRILFEVRERRPRPHKDDKILTDWNGLMIAALAAGSRVLDESSHAEAAERAASFILKEMYGESGLLHRYRDGEAAIHACLDDYAFLTWGLIELYEATFETLYLESAVKLQMEMIERFWDDKNGGFFFTGDDGEELLVRKKEIYDGAVPSGNSVAVFNLLRLGRMTENPSFEEKASRTISGFSGKINRSPWAHTQMITALDLGRGPTCEVVIIGERDDEGTRSMLKALNRHFIPNKVVLFRSCSGMDEGISGLPGFVRQMECIDGKATAYICSNQRCLSPTTGVDSMLELLGVHCR